MKEIARVVGVALSRVSQIRQAAVIKLRGTSCASRAETIGSRHRDEGSLPPCLIRNRCRSRARPKGGRPLAKTQKQKRCMSCNFRTAGRLSNENARALNAVHEAFARRLAIALDSWLGIGVEVKQKGLEQQPVKDHIAGIAPLTYIVPLTLSTAQSTMILECDVNVVFAMIEVLLGGSRQRRAAPAASSPRSKKRSCRTSWL